MDNSEQTVTATTNPIDCKESEAEEQWSELNGKETADNSPKHDVLPVRQGPKDRRSKANFISRFFFMWLDVLFCIGCRRDLKEDDMTVCPGEAESSILQKKFQRHWNNELERQKRGLKPRLLVALAKVCWWRFIVQGFIIFSEVALLNCQPIVLGYLSEYFALLGNVGQDVTGNSTECPVNLQVQPTSMRDAYLYAMGLFLIAIVIVCLHGHGFLQGQKIGMLMRIMTTTAIHKKVLSLSQVTIGKVSVGHVINLSSNDVHRFDLAALFIHYIWIAPLQLTLFVYLLYVEFGWTAVVGLVFILILLFFQFFLAKMFAWFRFKAARITDRRVRIMNEVVVGIRVIKMYAWEYAFKRVVKALRRSEVVQVFKGGVIRSFATGFTFGVSKVAIIYLIILSFSLAGGELSPKRVITSLSLVNVIRITIVVFVVRCFFTVYEGYVAIVRIQNFLLLEELSSGENYDDEPVLSNGVAGNGYRRESTVKILSGRETGVAYSTAAPVINTQSTTGRVSVRVSGLSSSWSYERDKQVLTDVTFDVDEQNSLLAVVGPVGSGKSTLLQCLLGELHGIDGSVTVSGRMSYTSQEPWIFSGTIRENILFGSPFRSDWYDEVIKACTLDKDIKLFVDGDLTLVGERGVTLSGGQKARVSLARAVYHDADIFLLDDPLSAVDAAVAKHLFDECICGLLKEKLVILVTHQVQFALEADKLLALKEGHVEIYGTHGDLAERGIEPSVLLGLIKEGEDEEKFDYESQEDEEQEEVPTSPTSPAAERSNFLSVPNLPRQRRRRRCTETDSLDEVHDILDESPFDNVSIYSAPSMLSINSAVETATSKYEEERAMEQTGPPSEERAHGNVSLKTYYKYFRAGGNFLFLAIVIVLLFVAEGGVVLTDWWLTDWANCDILRVNQTDNCQVQTNTSLSATCQLSRTDRLWIFSVLSFVSIVLYLIRAAMIYAVCINASRVLHNRMFATVLRAPIRFFDTNPSGRVLNRFSKDIGFLDDLLPQVLLEFLQLFIRFMFILITAIVANQWLLIPAAIVVVVFIFFRWYYLKTARDVKRLEALARSPIYSHVSTTLQGLPIIRIFGKQDIAQNLLYHYQDIHSEGWYAYLATTRWFGMRIDLLSAGFLAIVAFTSIPLAADLNAELVGLSLVYTASLAGMFQYCIRQSAELENIMISTERIIGYSNLQPEASLETLLPDDKPHPDWPGKGQIKMEDVAFQYSSELPLVLKNLDFTIQPAEKVGVVGRTGAGKSSLLSVLYRLAEPFGLITIDDVDIKTIGLHDLRSKMSIIPQDPVLFSGTMRYNLDPFDEFLDSDLWDVLEQVQLKVAVEQLEGQLGGEVSEGGSNFSVGQKQLVCLARALLRKNRILILDEATANVDPRTDEIIQRAIREKFTECTVITIAHRLNTIMDSDKILVMSSGQIKEFDSPLTLLQNPNSLLSKMVEKTGPAASRKLHQIALDAHSKRT